jgi:hypothetical protein
MSALEQQVKPIITPMFEDAVVTLDADQQRILGVWIAKMAFLFDSTKGRNAENKFYSRSEGAALRVSQQIPALTRIWIGRLDEVHRGITDTDFTVLSGTTRIGEGSVATLTNEHFIAQIVTLHLKEMPIDPAAVKIAPKAGDWENMLIPIHPIEFSSVAWPPKVSFTNGGPRGIAYLLDRWRIGEQVDKIKPIE